MVSDIINAVKNVENLADKKQEEAKKKAQLMLETAKKEAQVIIDAKIKEAGAKAELRINFAKSNAEEIFKKKMKKCEENIAVLKGKSDELKKKAIDNVINFIVN